MFIKIQTWNTDCHTIQLHTKTFSYLFYELVRVISCASKLSGLKGFWKLTTCLTTWANLFSSSLFCCLNKNCMFLLSFHSKNQRNSALAPSSINTFYVSCVCKCAPSRNSKRCLTHRLSWSLCNASVAFSSFGYNLTGLDRPKPFSATLRLLGLKRQRAHCLETFSFSLDWASKAEKMDINCIEFAENAVSLLRKHFQYGCTFTSQVYIHLKDRSYWERLRFVSKL